LYT
jgi:hypothetical protein